LHKKVFFADDPQSVGIFTLMGIKHTFIFVHLKELTIVFMR